MHWPPPPVGVGDGPPPLQAPLSVHTPWLLLPGMSPWVHHFAVHVCPLYETCWPPVYAVLAFQAGALQLPGEAGGVLGDVVGGAAPANWVVYLVKSQSFWVTLLQTPDVVLLGGLQARSRLTDQNVYRVRPWDEA